MRGYRGGLEVDRYDYIETIMLSLGSKTGINYQLASKEILKVYFEYKKKSYEMPDYYGGDQKNDGWVVEDALFYQVFAPTRLKESLRKEIQNKFATDLEDLIRLVYKEGKWNGEIKEFVFIVNTFDNNLPHDSERFFETKVGELKKKFAIEFEYKVKNSEYFRDLLCELDDVELLKRVSSVLKVKNLIDFNAITESFIIKLILEISGNINEQYMLKTKANTYSRVSSVKKIDINELNEKREEIEEIISRLDIVERAVNSINQEILCAKPFERVIDLVIKKYEKLSREYSGEDLYEVLIDEIIMHTERKRYCYVPAQFLIVYIFDKCDIFEKE